MTHTCTMKTDLSPARRRLVEEMQRLNFGHIMDLRVRNGEPAFDSSMRIIRRVQFGRDNAPHREASKMDFAIKAKVIELLTLLEEIGDGVIERIDVQDGLPCGMTYQENVA